MHLLVLLKRVRWFDWDKERWAGQARDREKGFHMGTLKKNILYVQLVYVVQTVEV